MIQKKRTEEGKLLCVKDEMDDNPVPPPMSGLICRGAYPLYSMPYAMTCPLPHTFSLPSFTSPHLSMGPTFNPRDLGTM